MITEVKDALKNYILERSEKINSELSIIAPGTELKKVYKFESANVPLGNYPCIFLGDSSFKKDWVAAPYLIEVRYEIQMSGYIVYADNEINAGLIDKFADVFSDIFEDKNGEAIQLENGHILHYHSEPPLDEMVIDYAMIGDAFCRSWVAQWHGWITRQTNKDQS